MKPLFSLLILTTLVLMISSLNSTSPTNPQAGPPGIGPRGDPKCRCSNSAPMFKKELTYNGIKYSYPKDVGTACKAWDQNTNPECLANPSLKWCS